MNGVRERKIISLDVIVPPTNKSSLYTLYPVTGGLTGLGKGPSSHIIVAVLGVIDVDITFIGGFGTTRENIPQ